jgi:hypothetical protein
VTLEAPPRFSAFVEPTILTDVTPEMRAYHEELFGPVAVVIRSGGPGLRPRVGPRLWAAPSVASGRWRRGTANDQ